MNHGKMVAHGLILFFSLTLGVALAQAPADWSVTRPKVMEALSAKEPDITQLEQYSEAAMRAGQLQDAVAICQAILRKRPDNGHAWLVLVQSYAGLGQAKEARESLPSLRRYRPDDPEVGALDGFTSFLEGDFVGAERLLQIAILQAKGRSTHAQRLPVYANSLVIALYQQGKKAEALSRTESFLEEYPEGMDLLLSASRLNRDFGNFEKALLYAQKGIALYPNRPNFFAAASLAHHKLGQIKERDEALHYLQQLDLKMFQEVKAVLAGQQDKPQIQVELK